MRRKRCAAGTSKRPVGSPRLLSAGSVLRWPAGASTSTVAADATDRDPGLGRLRAGRGPGGRDLGGFSLLGWRGVANVRAESSRPTSLVLVRLRRRQGPGYAKPGTRDERAGQPQCSDERLGEVRPCLASEADLPLSTHRVARLGRPAGRTTGCDGLQSKRVGCREGPRSQGRGSARKPAGFGTQLLESTALGIDDRWLKRRRVLLSEFFSPRRLAR